MKKFAVTIAPHGAIIIFAQSMQHATFFAAMLAQQLPNTQGSISITNTSKKHNPQKFQELLTTNNLVVK